jgi:hypothetical protein
MRNIELELMIDPTAVYINRLEPGFISPISSDANGPLIKTRMVIFLFPPHVITTGIPNLYKNYWVPSTSVPVTIYPRHNGWTISGPILSLQFQFPPIPNPGAFMDYLEALALWESTLFHCLEMNIYPTEMVSLLISNSFLSASDGSVNFSKNHSAFGWSLSLPNGRRLATCS